MDAGTRIDDDQNSDGGDVRHRMPVVSLDGREHATLSPAQTPNGTPAGFFAESSDEEETPGALIPTATSSPVLGPATGSSLGTPTSGGRVSRLTRRLFRRKSGNVRGSVSKDLNTSRDSSEWEISPQPTPNSKHRSMCHGEIYTVKVKEGEIQYEVKGEGEPIILLRGLARTRKHWMGFDELLAENFKVITLDPRQMGGSSASAPWDLTVESMAEDVLYVLDDCHLPRTHVLGVSLGAMVSLALSMRYPDRVKSVTVCNVSVADNDFNLPRLTFKGFWTVAKEVLRGKKEKGLANVMLSGLTDEERSYVEEEWNKIQKIEKVKAQVELKHGLAAARFQCSQDDLRSIDVPTLVIYGTLDSLVPREHSLYVHQHVQHSKLVAIRNGGHEITVDHPQEVRDALMEFVNDLPSHRLSQSYEKAGIKPLHWGAPSDVYDHPRRFSKYA